MEATKCPSRSDWTNSLRCTHSVGYKSAAKGTNSGHTPQQREGATQPKEYVWQELIYIWNTKYSMVTGRSSELARDEGAGEGRRRRAQEHRKLLGCWTWQYEATGTNKHTPKRTRLHPLNAHSWPSVCTRP